MPTISDYRITLKIEQSYETSGFKLLTSNFKFFSVFNCPSIRLPEKTLTADRPLGVSLLSGCLVVGGCVT